MGSLFDEAYAGPDPVFGSWPDTAFARLVLDNGLHGKALDLGCGDGRNSLFLAVNGFSVEACDLCEPAVAKLNNTARRAGLDVSAHVLDIRELRPPPDSYDLIVADTIFCHLRNGELHDLTEGLAASLLPGGYLYASAFSDCDPRASEFAPLVESWFAPREFCELFRGLRIRRCDELAVVDTRHGSPHPHVLVRLVAQRRQNLL